MEKLKEIWEKVKAFFIRAKWWFIIIGAVLVLALIGYVIFINTGANAKAQNYSVEGEIKQLSVDIKACDLSIEEGETFAVESNFRYLDVAVNNGSLSLNQTNEVGVRYNNVYVKLTVPTGFVFERVEMELGAGKVQIQSLSTVEMVLDLGAGDFTAEKLYSEYLTEIDCGAGKVTIKGGELSNAEIEVGAGSLDLTTVLVGRNYLKLGVGSIKMHVLEDISKYQLAVGTPTIGAIKVDGKEVKNIMIGNGQNRITIESAIGSTEINFG